MFDLPWGTHKVLLGVTKTVGCLDQLWTRSVSLKRPAQIVPKRKFWWHFRLWWWLAVQHLWMCLVQEYQTISFLLRTAHQEIFDSQTSLAAGSWVDSTGRVWVQGTQSFLVVHLGHLLFSPHLCELHATTSISIMSKMKCYCPTSSTCPSRNHIRCRRSLWSNLDSTASQLQGTKSTACFEIVNLSTYFIFLKQATATYPLAGPASWKLG